MRVFLWGFMGAGKSLVGRRLAARLAAPFLDLDEEVERVAGRSIPEIFERQGEDGFRDIEGRCLETVERWHNGVVATGGGTPTREENRRLMRRLGSCVWLDVPFDVVLARLDAAARRERPLFRDEGRARSLFDRRRSVYAEADLRVEIEPDDTPDEVAATIARSLREMP